MNELPHLVFAMPAQERCQPVLSGFEAGYQFHHARDGEEALRLAAEFKPAVMLSARILTDMSGYALCRQLHTLPDFEQLPFLLIARAAEVCDVDAALSSGVDAFLLAGARPEYAALLVDTLRKQAGQNARDALEDLDIIRDGRSLRLRTTWRRVATLLASVDDIQQDALRSPTEAALPQQATTQHDAFLATLGHALRDHLSSLLALAERVESRTSLTQERELAHTIRPAADALLGLADRLFEVKRRLNDEKTDARAPQPDPGRTEETLRILLAEDNPVNQAFVIHLLSSTGHSVTAVPNGRFALDALCRKTFDLVLMDIQMPELDGVETTRAIRNGAADRPDAINRNIPIIALTAYALQGDRERFLSAGMNDYLAKPVSSEQLAETITATITRARRDKTVRSASGTALPSQDAAEARSTQEPDVLNAGQTLRRLKGDKEFMLLLYDTFLKDFDNRLARLNDAYTATDFPTLKIQAHALKGATLTIDAAQASQAARELELACIEGNESRIDRAFGTLLRAMTVLRTALQNACGCNS